MLNRILFAVAPLMLIASSALANDDLLSAVAKLDQSKSDSTLSATADAESFGQLDVDTLLADGDQPTSEQAIAACFRRIGYGYRYGRGYRSYGRFCGYRNWYYPSYTTYYTYPALSCYRPVTYSYCAPIYSSYWGCW